MSVIPPNPGNDLGKCVFSSSLYRCGYRSTKRISNLSQGHILIKGQSQDLNPRLSDSEVPIVSPYFQFRGGQGGREGGVRALDSHRRTRGPRPSW